METENERRSVVGKFHQDSEDTYALPKMDLIFVTGSHAYPALLANPEVHLLGFNELTPHEQARVKKFTREKWEKVMEGDLAVSEQELIANAEKIILQDLADAKTEKSSNNENRAAQANKEAVADRTRVSRKLPSEVKSGSIKGN
ncbi:unnamed protein product [Hymenolepis diminuta]|uniref:XRN_N domain-containing protein n=1 Tax=Hymenolepis diminuta TaxID=6216 RepID=A0A0R3SP24_HYMDI|nr:unnamed protein product [Hymenolepis diminuta]